MWKKIKFYKKTLLLFQKRADFSYFFEKIYFKVALFGTFVVFDWKQLHSQNNPTLSNAKQRNETFELSGRFSSHILKMAETLNHNV